MEVWTPEGGFSAGPEMPAPFYGHCQVTLNETHVFIAGSDNNPEKAYLLDVEQARRFVCLKKELKTATVKVIKNFNF